MTVTADLPSTPVGEMARRVREARATHGPLRVVGAGTWLNGGAPVEATEAISCESHRGIVEYVPGDLTITVAGGTSLATISEATAVHDQWLTLDPFGSSAGTIGATVATASTGPLATGFGAPRDLALGIEAVTGTGNIVRGGGRVVKNVAGFDLVRLFTGSRGTLGVITEVTLRLRARPAKEITVAIGVSGMVPALRAVTRALREWPFTPMAAEMIDAGCAVAAGLPQVSTLLLRLGGNARAIVAQRKRAASLGPVTEIEPGVWDRLRAIETGSAAVMRVVDLPSAFAERWVDAQQVAGRNGVVIGSPARGSVRCILGEVDTARISALRARSKTAAVIFESLPTASAWHSLTDAVSPGTLDSRVRAAFDPDGILNPGIMRVTR